MNKSGGQNFLLTGSIIETNINQNLPKTGKQTSISIFFLVLLQICSLLTDKLQIWKTILSIQDKWDQETYNKTWFTLHINKFSNDSVLKEKHITINNII